MHTFIGTKLVRAKPLTRGEYNVKRGWEPPAGEPQDVDGYLVEYPDGYISWSPAKQFEEAYVDLGNISHRLPYEQRLIGERAELDKRLEKLRVFMAGPAFEGVYAAEQDRLREQYAIMADLSIVLAERIEAFED